MLSALILMPPDKPTLEFLNSFSVGIRREADLVAKDGAVTRIYGGENLIEARVETNRTYRVRLFRMEGAWQGEVSPEDDHAGVVMVASMLERLRLGDKLPESADDPGDKPLAALIEEKLDRNLSPREELFVGKIEKRFQRFLKEGAIRDTDLVRLSPKWQVESMDPLNLWETPPTDALRFWNHIAYAFSRKNIPLPPFMEPVTDLESIAASRRETEEKARLQLWRDRIERAAASPTESAITPLELRLLVGPSDARLQWRAREETAWTTASSRAEVDEIEGKVLAGRWRPTAAGALLLAHYDEHLQNEGSDVFDLDRESACRLINRFFHHEGMWDLIVTLDEQPFQPAPGKLAWTCLGGGSADEGYTLSLHTPDGSEIPHSVRALPGAEDLYLADDTVFRGPMHWGGGTEIDPRHELPRELIESSDGIAFLDRIGAAPPPHLAARIVDHSPEVRIQARIARNLTTADSEHMVLEIRAEDSATGGIQELRRQEWIVTREPDQSADRIVRPNQARLDRVRREVLDLGFVFDESVSGHKSRVSKVFPARFHAWAKSLPDYVVIDGDDLTRSLLADPITARLRLEVDDKGIDWFDLKVAIDLEGVDLSQEEIRALVAARGGFLRLKDGTWARLELDLDDDQREAIEMLGLDPFDTSGEPQRLHATQIADPAIREAFDPRAWEKICQRAASLQTAVKPDVPDDLKATLRPYQIDGFHFLSYLATNSFGGVLADDMGLGKTVQSLAWVLWLRSQKGKQGKPALVVCPKSVIDVWVGEAERFAPELDVRVLRADGDTTSSAHPADLMDGDLVVMNYAQLRIHRDALKETQWLAVILDEGQQIKNPDSQAARAARELDALHRLVLTGTPIENRLLDLWSLMAFAMPGILGKRSHFSKRFDRRKDPEAARRLTTRLRPFLLRRTKSQVARDLPPRTEEDVYCDLEGAQRDLYQAELSRIQRVLLGIERDEDLARQSFVILQGLMRLRQICCHPSLADSSQADVPSAKINALFYLLDQLREEGHKVLVFSQFVGMLDIIRERLRTEKRPFSYLTGSTRNRREVVDHFQRTQDPEVFLLSLKAGGSGLNLTSASYVILYDPWWNPAVENQAIDRTHRIGQTQRVNAYRLLMRDTVEQKIRVLQQQKQSLFSGVLGQESFARNLTVDDVRYLFQRNG